MQASRHNARVPGLADDHFAIAHAHCRLKTQPELWFDEPAKVYSFFDFTKARGSKPCKVKVVVALPYA